VLRQLRGQSKVELNVRMNTIPTCAVPIHDGRHEALYRLNLVEASPKRHQLVYVVKWVMTLHTGAMWKQAAAVTTRKKTNRLQNQYF
jgi:hypothetical protein